MAEVTEIKKTARECFDDNINIYNAVILTGLSRGRIMNLYASFRVDDIIVKTTGNIERISKAKTMELELINLIEITRNKLTPETNNKIEMLQKKFCVYCA